MNKAAHLPSVRDAPGQHGRQAAERAPTVKGFAKLTPEDVIAIRQNPLTGKVLAPVRVSQIVISKTKTGRKWADVSFAA